MKIELPGEEADDDDDDNDQTGGGKFVHRLILKSGEEIVNRGW